MKRVMMFLVVLTWVANNAAAQDTAPRTKRTPIDGIVAVVEDEAIFRSDVEQMIKQFMFQQRQSSLSDSERTELANKVLQDLINDKLVIAQAGRLDIEIPFSEVEDQVTRAIDENIKALGGQAQFEAQLEREGFTIDSLKKLYRDQIRNRMLVERVLQTEVARNGDGFSESSLRDFYEEKKSEMPMRPAVVHLKTIFIGFDTASSAREAARAKIEDLHRRLLGGESFVELAKANSEDPSAPLGGDLGFVKPEDLREPVFREAVRNLDVGEISEPVLTSYGFHIIQVSERDPETGDPRIRHILVRVKPSDDDIQQVFESANDIYQQLREGASFEELADRFSTDPTAAEGGDLGWLKVDDLPPFFQEVLADMKPGNISQVLRESTGFRIVKLEEREDARPYAFEEVQKELKALYQQERMADAFSEYVATLRDRFSVEIVGDVSNL